MDGFPAMFDSRRKGRSNTIAQNITKSPAISLSYSPLYPHDIAILFWLKSIKRGYISKESTSQLAKSLGPIPINLDSSSDRLHREKAKKISTQQIKLHIQSPNNFADKYRIPIMPQ